MPAGCRAPLIGKGASLPSVAGAGALQPCAGRLKQSIIIVGNKHRLPAKSWSALSVGAFYFLPTILAARILKYFSSSNIMLFIEIVVVTGNVFGHATFFKKSFPSNELLLFLQHCDMVAIIGADRLQILSERLGASRLIWILHAATCFMFGSQLAVSESGFISGNMHTSWKRNSSLRQLCLNVWSWKALFSLVHKYASWRTESCLPSSLYCMIHYIWGKF